MVKEGGVKSLRARLRRYYEQQQDDANRMYGDAGRRHKQRCRLETVQRVLGQVELEGRRLLEVGCGDGYATEAVVQDAAYSCYAGVDLSRLKLRRLGSRMDRVLGIQGDAEALPLGSETFDVVLCLEVLEHLVLPEAALMELHRVLVPGGTVVLSMPVDNVLQPVWNRLREHLPVPRGSRFDEHIQVFTRSRVRALLARSGFVGVDERPCAFAFPLDTLTQRLPYSVYRRVDRLMCRIPIQRFGVGLSLLFPAGVAFGREYLVLVVKKPEERRGRRAVPGDPKRRTDLR